MNIKLSEWAEINSYSYRGAYDRFRKGNIKGQYINDTGRLMVSIENESKPTQSVVTYARVSNAAQRENANRQSKRIQDFCNARGMIVTKSFVEVASGMNDQRKVLDKIMKDESITHIVVENKDRLTRFGFNYLSSYTNKTIIVMNENEGDKEDLMQDMISLITSMVARYYGKRRSANIKEKTVKALTDA